MMGLEPIAFGDQHQTVFFFTENQRPTIGPHDLESYHPDSCTQAMKNRLSL